jgi:hypothetical protein
VDDTVVERIGRRFGRVVDDEPRRVAVEADGERRRRGASAVFGDECGPAVSTEEVEVAVAPGVQVSRAAKGLAGIGGAGLTDVMDEDDGDTVFALEAAQEAEELADLGGGVFVAAVQADERIENEHPRFRREQGEREAPAVEGIVEVKRGGADPADGEAVEVDPAGGREAGDALFDGECCVSAQ